MISMLLEKAALRRLKLPAAVRELFLTGSALEQVVLPHCEQTVCILILIFCFERRNLFCPIYIWNEWNETKKQKKRKYEYKTNL